MLPTTNGIILLNPTWHDDSLTVNNVNVWCEWSAAQSAAH